MLGVALGILGMRFAAGLFSYAVQREPVLKNAAYLLVLIIGLELLFSEISGQAIDDWLRFAISAGTILLCLIYAHLPFRASLRPLIAGARHAFSHINALASWLLDPFSCLLRWLFGAGKALARRLMPTQDRAGE